MRFWSSILFICSYWPNAKGYYYLNVCVGEGGGVRALILFNFVLNVNLISKVRMGEVFKLIGMEFLSLYIIIVSASSVLCCNSKASVTNYLVH